MDEYGYTYQVSSHFARIYTYRPALLAEMVPITADQSQINLDFSPVRTLTTWLLRTSYIGAYSSSTFSEWYHETNQSTHIYTCMDHTKTQKLLRPIIFFGGRIFTVLRVRHKK